MSATSAIPRHLRSPGDDGYRTPTIEDAEEALSLQISNGDSLYASMRIRQVHTSALEALHDRTFRTAGAVEKEKKLDDCIDGSGLSRRRTESSFPTNLSWKQRIRHFTWAFFTLTMATGGIANALYNGNNDGHARFPILFA